VRITVEGEAMSRVQSTRIVGHRARRIEDPALLRGAGRFIDDIRLPGMLQAAFVRSPHAHAKVVSIDASAARVLPGVVAVFDAQDIAKGLTRLRMPLGYPTPSLPPNITPFVLTPREVCFVGEALALVVACSRYVAEDAAAMVDVEYEPLPALSDCRGAIDPASPKVRLEAPSNVLTRFRVAYGECTNTFSDAVHVFGESIRQHRGAAHPIETRGAAATFDPATGSLTMWSSTQMPHGLMYTLADMLGLAENRVRVISPDVGGGFGCKFLVYPEEIAIGAAAKLLAQPVKWIEDRQEHFLAAPQERDQQWDVEIAVDREAKILGIRGRLIHDQGAYTPQGINLPFNSATAVTGPYIVPNYDLDVHVAQTNMVYVTAVRGACHPQAAFVMERLLDRVASELKLDRAEVRRRNLVPRSKMPYKKPIVGRSGVHMVLDSGDYHACLEKVLARIDYAGFAARQKRARAEGRYTGIGLANGVKGTGRGPFESGTVKVSPSGRVSVFTGGLAMGQGIKTTLAQVCAEQLGVRVEDIEVVAGDTGFVSLGMGGFGSRLAVTAGSSIHLAAVAVRDKALKVAAKALEAAEADLELRDGKVVVKGTDMGMALAEISRVLRGVPGYGLPEGIEPGLEATFHWKAENMPYVNACHACEVEVDVDTGGVKILRYVALQDCGRMINPLIVEGQFHGGIVHGIGNALFESMRHDAQGQPITTTFADYLLPTSTEVPAIELLSHESPSPFNPLGVKGVGEGGTIPVAAAIISAIENALELFGVHITQAPLSPVRILELIEESASPGHGIASY
jgi:carbon-monoxide dehydrogenase large subunit